MRNPVADAEFTGFVWGSWTAGLLCVQVMGLLFLGYSRDLQVRMGNSDRGRQRNVQVLLLLLQRTKNDAAYSRKALLARLFASLSSIPYIPSLLIATKNVVSDVAIAKCHIAWMVK